MAFNAFLRFLGLCANVPNQPLDKSPTKLWVVMPDAREPSKLPSICKHYPGIFLDAFRLADSDDAQTTSDGFSSGKFFWGIARQEITLKPYGAKGAAVPSLTIPSGDAETDFRYVPNLGIIFKKGATITPDFREDKKSLGTVISRVVLEQGTLRAGKRSNNAPVFFPGGDAFETEDKEARFAHDTFLDLGELDSLEIHARDLDTNKTKKLVIGEGTGICVIGCGNLCAELWLHELAGIEPYLGDTPQGDVIDLDFEELYNLSYPPLSGDPKGPVPKSKGGGGWGAKCHQAIFNPFIEEIEDEKPKVKRKANSALTFRAQTRYHTQDTGDYCGAAVAMMLFEHLSIGRIQQGDLYTIGSNLSKYKKEFFIDPEGLKGLLNQRLAETGRSNRYVVRFCASGEEAVKALAASLAQNPPLPGFTLDQSHWVLVDGVEQQNGAIGACTGDLWIHYPILDNVPFPLEDETPPHGAADLCGSSESHGFLQAAFRAKAWSKILKPHPKLGSIPLVIIPPPAEAAQLPLAEEDDADTLLPGWVRQALPEEGHTIGEPIFVAAPLEEGGAYQLAPIQVSGGRIGWVLSADGKRKGVALYSRPQTTDILSEEEAIIEAQKEYNTEERPLAPPSFIWQFSRESPMRFIPFREVRFDVNRTAYVRIDRKTFRRLSLPEKSG